ncbi:arginase family protein [Ktedonosporobacter rubrisoli]|nr:arginase family protein [Ktedonosporobacter rubrisoli]
MKQEKEPIYSGIATYLRTPYIHLNEAQDYDVAILGIPVDYGTTVRSGQRFAPRAIREYSFYNYAEDEMLFDLSTDEPLTAARLLIGDLGDIAVWPANPEKTNEAIIQTVCQVRTTTFPFIFGGDHSITYATFLGCKQALDRQGQMPLGLLHFDAHLDVDEDFLTMPRVHHGNVFGQLIREGHLQGEHVVSIGIRGLDYLRCARFAKNAGIKQYTAEEVRKHTLETIMNEAIALLKNTCRAVYVTFDIDCIDPSQAPGTGTPVFGGLLLQEVLPALRLLSQLPVVAFDLVELSPSLDTTGITTVAASEILWQFLAFGLAI